MNSFIEKMAVLYQAVPSPILVSVRLAQACLESSFGQSELARNARNFAGIKASSPWIGETYTKLSDEEIYGQMELKLSEFRKYESVEEFVKDHSGFITSTEHRKQVYAKVIQAVTYQGQCAALTGTYATDSRYGAKLIEIIEKYDLTQYDRKDVPKMAKVLFIAGHGEQPGGGFDTGAVGGISLGEHRYMEQKLFPAIKKFLPQGADVAFYSEHDCYAYGDIVAQARKYGNDTIVIECHYDATGNATAKGGHVIVWKGFEPDMYDIALRDALKNSIGIFASYKHHGHAGISGRDDLANASRTANSGVNWRLLELGFCTNPQDVDYMLNRVDDIAKAIVQALFGKVQSPQPKAALKPVDEVAREVLAGRWGNGQERKNKLTQAGYSYDEVQNRVNELKVVPKKEAPSVKPDDLEFTVDGTTYVVTKK